MNTKKPPATRATLARIEAAVLAAASGEAPEAVTELRVWGQRGGQSTSPKKAAAARRNGAVPAGPGKRRGWPKGKPRGPRKPTPAP